MNLAGGLLESSVASLSQRRQLSFANLLVLSESIGDARDVSHELVPLHPSAATGAKLAVDILDLVNDVDDVGEAE
jgi:hypothetical protein